MAFALHSARLTGSVNLHLHHKHKIATVYRPKSRANPIQSRRSVQTVASLDDTPEPDSVKGAIAIGLSLFEQGRYDDAQALFERALSSELPGSGLKRFRDKPRLMSDGEKQSALFNIACCLSKKGEINNGLIALAGCLEAGYDNFRQLRNDPDLENLRKDEKFEGLMKRFDKGGGFMGLFKSF